MLLTLWRRAPLWRLLLGAGVVFTGLAAMFPPPGTQHASEPVADFVMPPDRVPTGMGTVVSPAATVVREGVIPYAGRQLPLPAGQWQLLSVGRDEGAQPKQVFVLGSVRGTQFRGLLVALAPDAVSQASGFLQIPDACSQPDRLAGEITPVTDGQNPFLHECWIFRATPLGAVVGSDVKGGLMQRAYARLVAMGVALPERLDELRYIRSTESGWFMADLYVPAPSNGTAGSLRAWVGWARKYTTLLHRGFDDTLAKNGPPPDPPPEPG